MELKVRQPDIDFEECFPKWAPNIEFAYFMNAFSIIPVHLEPYIIKVYAEAKKLLDPVRDAELIKEVEWFMAQEGQHYRQHVRFNKIFEIPRYPDVTVHSKQYRQEIEEFRKNKSMLFNLAYIEGFESAGGVFYRIWFEKLGKYRIGARQEALLLYDWHFAEEFEHKEVAYKLYMAIAAKGSIFRRIWYGYFYRIFGVLKMLAHSGKFIDDIREHMLEVERAEMTPEKAELSRKGSRKLKQLFFWMTIKDLLAVISPFYDPAGKKPPEGVEEILASFDAGGMYGKPVEDAAAAS